MKTGHTLRSRLWVRTRCVLGVLFIFLVAGPFKLTKAEWAGIWTMFKTGVPVPRPATTDNNERETTKP